VPAAEILAGRRVSIRVDEHTLMFFDPDTRHLLRTRTNPLTPAEVLRLRTARPAGPPPQPPTDPVTVQRRKPVRNLKADRPYKAETPLRKG
jgi:hypothetical protein